ncbi:MAG TPA: Fic family protein [Candidatus Aminicenantes bacterium]|nr:Fic family protein [Candidatus Aminicenantes bacterium]
MARGMSGEYVVSRVGGEEVRAFVPFPLPPQPPLDLSGSLNKKLEKAHLALGRLDSITSLLPEPGIFLYTYVRHEAVMSSQIEGTQSSLEQLMLFELNAAPGVPLNDVAEVSNYVAAMTHGMQLLKNGLPLCNRVLREMHVKMLAGGRGSSKSPGEFRRSQNWIGGIRPGKAHFVPPPPDRVEACMAEFERFLHADDLPFGTLVKAALAHVQFETIHPFLDGNGRIGRLLISFILHQEGVLAEPLLYPSLYFKQNRDEYFHRLDQVRSRGEWEGWLNFFLEGIERTAHNAVNTAHKLESLFQRDRGSIRKAGGQASSTLRVFNQLCRRPLLTISEVSKQTGLSAPTVTKAVNALIDLGIVRELTGKKRNRVFGYQGYITILNQCATEL